MRYCRRSLPPPAARLEVAALLGLEDHPFAGTIFTDCPGFMKFGLAENGAAGRLGSLLQLDSGVLPMASTTSWLMFICENSFRLFVNPATT